MQIYYFEIVTANVDAICDLYGRLYNVPFGEPIAGLGGARTADLSNGGKIGVRGPLSESEEPTMRPYILVDDIEAAVKKAVEQGSTIAHPPLEIPGHGTFAIIDEGGLLHGIWQQ